MSDIERKQFQDWLFESRFALASPQTQSCMLAAWQAKAEELTRLQSEVERMRGRCGELESELSDCLELMEESERRYEICQEPPNMNDQIDAVKELLGRDSGSKFWLLNRQADAVEFVLDKLVEDQPCVSANVTGVINYYAQRLRQQAAESEK